MTSDLAKYQRSHASLSLNYMASVKDCMLEMTKHANVMIDNADAYSGGGIYIGRLALPGQRGSIYAHQDIDYLVRAAVKCIDIIDKHVIPE